MVARANGCRKQGKRMMTEEDKERVTEEVKGIRA